MSIDTLPEDPEERSDAIREAVEELVKTAPTKQEELRDLIVKGFRDETSLVREGAISLAARYLEPEVIGKMIDSDEDALMRNAAITAMRRQGPYALPYLQKVLRGDNLELIMFVVGILASTNDPSAVQLLLPLLDHQDPNLQQVTIEALGGLKSREAVPKLLPFLKADLWLQIAAVTALSGIGDERAVDPLLGLVGHQILSESALSALGQIASPKALDRLIELLCNEERLPLRDHLLCSVAAILQNGHDIGKDSQKKLTEAVKNGSLLNYLEPIMELSGSKHEPATDIVYPNYDDRSADRTGSELLRSAVVLTMAANLESLYPTVLVLSTNRGMSEWIKKTCKSYLNQFIGVAPKLLTHEDAEIRRAALMIGAYDQSTAALVRQCLEDELPEIRAQACSALGSLKDVASIDVLSKRLVSENEIEKNAAVSALGNMPPESLQALHSFLDLSKDKTVVKAVLGILEATKSTLFKEDVWKLMECDDPSIRRAALRVLAGYPEKKSLQTITASLQDDDVDVQTEAIEQLVELGRNETLPELMSLLERELPIRYRIIRALGTFQDDCIIKPLIKLYTKAPAHEQIEILATLIQTSSTEIIPFLKQQIASSNIEIKREAAHGLARLIREDERDLLISLAGDADWYVRNEAAWGMGRLALAEFGEVLLTLARDVESVVARTARAALKKIPGTHKTQ